MDEAIVAAAVTVLGDECVEKTYSFELAFADY